mgnify:CR=1 FL=1
MTVVVAFHLGRLGGGFLGVDVFFVVSGFLITRILLAEADGTGSIGLARFWGRRVRRLLPALLVVLVAVAVAGRVWLPGWRLADLRADALSAIGYVANWRFVASGQSYFAEGLGPSPLRHTWSLAIEEQFYLLWLLVVAVVVARTRGDRHRWVRRCAGAAVLLSAAWMVRMAGSPDLSRVYFGTDTRIFALAAGAWLGAWWPATAGTRPPVRPASRRSMLLARAGAVALAALAVLVVVAAEDEAWFYRGGFQVAAVLAVMAVAGLASGHGLVARTLSLPAFVWVGRRSYGIYLWSWPIQVFAGGHLALSGPTLDLTVVVLSVAVAALSYRLVEMPVRRERLPSVPRRPVGHRPSIRPRWSGVAAALPALAAVAVVSAVVVGATSGGRPAPEYLTVSDDAARATALRSGSAFDPVPGSATPVAPVASISRGRVGRRLGARARPALATVSHLELTGEVFTGPLPGPPARPLPADAAAPPEAVHGRPLRVLLSGDSVGWTLGWTDLGPLRSSFQVSNRALIGCGIMPPGTAPILPGGPRAYPEQCADRDRADVLGLAEGPDVVLLWIGAWEVFDHRQEAGPDLLVGSEPYGRVLEEQLQRRIDTYRDAGVPTVIPLVGCYGPSTEGYDDVRQDPDRRRWVNQRIRAVAADNRGWVRVIEPGAVLCGPDGAAVATIPSGAPLRPDGAHFDRESARWLWESWLAPQLGASFVQAP